MTFNPSSPVAGFYRTKLVKGGPWVPVRIWYGPPLDPETGEELDRSPRWQALVNGEEVDGPNEVEWVWVWCSNKGITEAEYRYMLAKKEHAEKFAPELPEASPREKIDLNKLPPLF